jgi:hypothetical protein
LATARLNIRNLALALAVGALVALVVDVALQNALDAVRSPGARSMTPWWVVGRVAERSLWLVFALLTWLLATALARIAVSAWPGDHGVDRVAAFDIIGQSMIVFPVVWLLATWLVVILRITLTGSWAQDGAIFFTSAYYYNVALGYVPWAAGGLALLMFKRHV